MLTQALEYIAITWSSSILYLHDKFMPYVATFLLVCNTSGCTKTMLRRVTGYSDNVIDLLCSTLLTATWIELFSAKKNRKERASTEDNWFLLVTLKLAE